jgi:pilus assembly protein Flp/PilA
MWKLYATLLTLGTQVRDRFASEDEGATAVEYGIMVALIAVAIIVTVGPLGLKLQGLFGNVANNLP